MGGRGPCRVGVRGDRSLKHGQRVWRVGHAGVPWDFTPRKHCKWAHRFDDPLQRYRVLYCAEVALTSLYEVLIQFRPDLKAIEDFNSFVGKAHKNLVIAGALPRDWRQEKELVSGLLDLQGRALVDLTQVTTMVELEHQIPGLLRKHGAERLDHAVLRGGNRGLTQAVSRFAFGQKKAGILYRSRVDDSRCLALFEGRAQVDPQGPVRRLDKVFPLLARACADLKIML
jgi:RES domain